MKKSKYINWTLSHEHLSIDFSPLKNDPDTKYEDHSEIINEFNYLKSKGLESVVDVSTLGMKRDLSFIDEFEKITNIKVLRATGFYKEPFIPEKIKKMSVGELVKWMENDDISNRHLLGEIGTSENKITEVERRVFEASSIISKKYDIPIYTHTTLGTFATEQTKILKEFGIEPKKIIIGHQDLNKDIEEVIAIARMGFYIGIDTIGKNNYASDESRIKLIKKLIDEGYEKQIILSMDMTRLSDMKSHGGIGYGYFIDEFIPKLETVIGKDSIQRIISENPKKVFTI